MSKKVKVFYGSVKNKAAVAGAAATGLLLSGMASAQTDPFTAAVADATTKVGTYGAAMVGLAAVAVAFMIGIKYVKKIPRVS